MQDVQLKTLEWRAKDTMIVALHVPTYVPYRQSVDNLDNPNPLYPEHCEWFNASRVLRNMLQLWVMWEGDGMGVRKGYKQPTHVKRVFWGTNAKIRFVGLSLCK
jgi:hypothetical protein